MVEVGTGGTTSRFLKTKWPHTEGLTAGTQKQTGRSMQLEPQGKYKVKTTVKQENKKGMDY